MRAVSVKAMSCEAVSFKTVFSKRAARRVAGHAGTRPMAALA